MHIPDSFSNQLFFLVTMHPAMSRITKRNDPFGIIFLNTLGDGLHKVPVALLTLPEPFRGQPVLSYIFPLLNLHGNPLPEYFQQACVLICEIMRSVIKQAGDSNNITGSVEGWKTAVRTGPMR